MALHGHLQQVRLKIIFFGVICLALAGVSAWKFYVLQIERHAELLGKARKSYIHRKVIKRERGRIYDADGNPVSVDEQTMTSKAGFFQKIIAFSKNCLVLPKQFQMFLNFNHTVRCA